MRPSDLLLDFGRPVAYYPGLVKTMGSPHAVIFFGQIFYWQDKTASDIGVHKTREQIEEETGLTFEQQATARKHLVSRGILVETNKRLEHKIYYRIDVDRLDEIICENSASYRNGESRFREEGNSISVNSEITSPRVSKTPRRRETKPVFDPSEITTEITTENKTLNASDKSGVPTVTSKKDFSPDFETAWTHYPKRAGSNNKKTAWKAWRARIKSGASPQEIIYGVQRYAAFVTATGKLNTEFVKQATTFFGPAEHYAESWDLPAANTGNSHYANTSGESVAVRQIREAFERMEQNEGHEFVDCDGANLRPAMDCEEWYRS